MTRSSVTLEEDSDMTEPALAQSVKGKGRHYSDPRTDTLVPSVTNVIGTLDKPAIGRWAAKVVAEQAVALAGSLANLDPHEAVDMLKSSPWRNSTRAASRGTSIHEVLERLTLGEDAPALTGPAAEYQTGIDLFLAEHEIEPWHTEISMFGQGYAGTADLIGVVDGKAAVLDYKSGKGLYDEVSLQLAALRACDVMVVDGEIVDVPPTEIGVAVLIKPDGYLIKQVDDLDACYRAFMSLLDVWRWKYADGRKLVDYPVN